MKKFFLFIIVLVFAIVFISYFKNQEKEFLNKIVKDTEDKEFSINRYIIFGTHFNIEGCIDESLDKDSILVLKNKNEEISLDAVFEVNNNETCFYTSKQNNTGIYLDDLKRGEYVLLVKSGEEYYSLKNNTDYKNLEYYTITKNNSNNKINIDFKSIENKNYISFSIKNSSLPKDVYDITIDPGHGGNDPGASYKLNGKVYTESELTLKIALLLKKDLENLGLKVKLTRTGDTTLDNYGENGRAVIPNKVKSKYSLSLHLNSAPGTMNYGGVEVYTPNDIDYTLSKLFADNLSEIVGYSKKPTDKLYSGVYFTKFTNSQVKEASNDTVKKGLKAYDIKVGFPYMFMIREVGGISTFAYVDNRNDSSNFNLFYNSNQTAEPYLIELGYINYKNDLENLSNRSESFSKAITKAFKKYLNIS